VGPEEADLRVARQELLDRVGVHVGVQEQVALRRQLDDPPDDGRVHVGATEVELADAAVDTALESLLHVFGNARVCVPGRPCLRACGRAGGTARTTVGARS